MNNLEKYREIFETSFQYEGDVSALKYQDIPAWDSVGHMQLMTKLEEEFDIEMDVDDIIDFSSFEKGIEILKKYSVNF